MFRRDGVVFRQIQPSYSGHYEALLASGLHAELVAQELLLPHEEVPLQLAAAPGAFRVIRPIEVPFVSYPFEWCFDQLRDAALLTLEIMSRSLARGLVLKDASAYNVQFIGARPIFIDTLSFEKHQEGRPWVAYRQFCQHFLAPLLLAARVDERLIRLLRTHLDGIPLDLTSRLLPAATWLRFGSLLHLHLHARSQRRYERGSPVAATARGVSRTALLGLAESLRSTIAALDTRAERTEWSGYEEEHNYSETGHGAKRGVVDDWLRRIHPAEVWDLGANTGLFARLAAERGARVVALDADAGAVARAYRRLREQHETRILPLVMDLTNPTPRLGWGHREIESLFDRARPDAVLCLALVHHLAITYNLPLDRIVDVIADLAPNALVEFVPKDDPQAQRLLASREDVFAGYSRPAFEAALRTRFHIDAAEPVPDSQRVLYRLRRLERAERESTVAEANAATAWTGKRA